MKTKIQFILLLVTVFIKPINLISQWSQAGSFPGQLVFCITDAGGNLAAGTSISILTSGDIYVSPAGGNNWGLVSSGLGLSGIFDLAYKDNIIFAGTYEDGLLKSTNSGMNWTAVNVNGNIHTGIFKLGVSGQNLFAYANTGAAYYVSSNNGDSWVTASGYTGGVTNQLYDNGTLFYAASYKGIYTSSNNGFNWVQKTNTGLPANPDGTKRTMCAVTSAGKLFTATNNPVNSVYISSDNGDTWQGTGINFPANTYVKSMVSLPGKLFIGVYGSAIPNGSVMMTTDEGASWINVSGGIPAGLSINDMIISSGSIFVCTNFQGIWKAQLDQLTSIENIHGGIVPAGFELKQNYPNPFNPETKITFSIPQSMRGNEALFRIYEASGSEIKRYTYKNISPGTFEINFRNENLNSGVYFYSITSGSYSLSKKMILLK